MDDGAGVELVPLDDVLAARARIGGSLRDTPVWRAASLSALAGRDLWVKAESLQRTGSFKPRGALNFLRADPDDRRPVVAASAGNHAQGVALAAAEAGVAATVFMPLTASLPKVRATRDYGAEVHQVGDTVDDAIVVAEAHAEATGGRFLSPFDHPLVIAGQGTVGLELVEQLASLRDEPVTVLVPVGGGGLVSGVAVALREQAPGWRVVGVEAAGAASMVASLAAGHPVPVEHPATMADGIALKAPSALTLAHVAALVDEVVTVDEEEIAAAVLLLLERARCVVEPAGAVGLAAVLGGRVDGTGPVACLLSGGNVDPMLLTGLIEHGLTVAGRYLRLRAVIPDRPGALALLTRVLADLGLNVTDVEHHRAGIALGVDEVEVLVTVETRDRAHGDEVLAALRDAGVHAEVVGPR